MRNKLIPLLILIPLTFLSCQSPVVFKEYHKFPGYTWERNDDIVFRYENSDISSLYDFEVQLRHMTGFPYDEMVLVFRIVSPSGNVRSMEHRIRIKDEDGNYIADGMGDLWDLSATLLGGVTLPEEGEYIFEFNNVMPRVRISGLMELGLKVSKTNEKAGEER